jgi:hypothetical protein
MKPIAALVATFVLGIGTASAAPSYVLFESSLEPGANSARSPRMIARVGETSTVRLAAARDKPELLVRVTPVVSKDDTVVIESTVSVNKMVDGAPHLFDKQIAQISTRSALGEKSSVEVAQGMRYEWVATALSDEEANAKVKAEPRISGQPLKFIFLGEPAIASKLSY